MDPRSVKSDYPSGRGPYSVTGLHIETFLKNLRDALYNGLLSERPHGTMMTSGTLSSDTSPVACMFCIASPPMAAHFMESVAIAGSQIVASECGTVAEHGPRQQPRPMSEPNMTDMSNN